MGSAAPNVDWYCRRGSELLGPISTARLEQMIAARSLRDHDHVRIGADGAWISVAEIHRLFEGEAPTVDAAEAARAALARTARAQLAVQAEDDVPRLPRRNRLRALAAAADVLTGTVGRVLGGAAALIGRVFVSRPVRWGVVAATIAACAWGAYWLVIVPRLPLSPENALAEYQQFWNTIEAAGRQSTSDAEWSAIAAHGESLAARFEPALKHHADSRSPVLQELLWGTPYLMPAVRDARDGKQATSEAVSKFVIHLQNAQRRLAREKEVAEEQPAALAAAAARADREQGDRLLMGFLVIDGILVLAAGAFVVRRVLQR